MRKSQIFQLLISVWSRIKPYCRWVILGGTIFFIAKALKDNWQEVAAIRIAATGWATLAIALGVTLLSLIWTGWVWTWILRELSQPVSSVQFIQVYLKTNIAKYLPGNVWHFYGRIAAAKKAGIPADAATFGVLLEPILVVAAALIVVLIGVQPTAPNQDRLILQVLPMIGLATVLIAIHPRFLNIALQFVGRLKLKATKSEATAKTSFQIKSYLFRPLIGELGFIGLRSAGFLFALLAVGNVELQQIPLLAGAFSLAYLLGLIIPGAPGGLGVFEATAIALLDQHFSAGLIISAIALYRLISILAEMAGAGLAWLDEHLLINQN